MAVNREKWDWAVPFLLDGEPWVMRTNGQAGVLARGVVAEDETVRDNIMTVDEVARKVLGADVHLANRDALFALRVVPDPTCGDCGGTGRVECDECAGTGEAECECRCGDTHEAECEECDGGEQECDCVTSGVPGPRPAKIVPARLGGVPGSWDRRLLTRVLNSLPDGPVAAGVVDGMLVLAVGDVRAVAMPLHRHEDAPLHEIGLLAMADNS